LKPSTAPCGIHDNEVTEDSIRMAALPELASARFGPSADGHNDVLIATSSPTHP
jgi:hypothetical protein